MESKFENISNIAKEINIGVDSIFMDDNPAEKGVSKGNLPMVEVPDIGSNIVDYIDHIDKNGYFGNNKSIKRRFREK